MASAVASQQKGCGLIHRPETHMLTHRLTKNSCLSLCEKNWQLKWRIGGDRKWMVSSFPLLIVPTANVAKITDPTSMTDGGDLKTVYTLVLRLCCVHSIG